MAGLPPDVHDRYRQLARRRNWPPATLAAILRSVAWYRALDERPAEHGYFERTNVEGLTQPGTPITRQEFYQLWDHPSG